MSMFIVYDMAYHYMSTSAWSVSEDSVCVLLNIVRPSAERRLHLPGPELAICWAFKRHIEMALTPLCLFIIVFQVFVQGILTDTIAQQNCQSVRRRGL